MTADGARDGAVEERLTQVLGAWAVGSLLGGAALCLRPATRGFGYLAAGIALLQAPAARARGWRGDGLAVVVQGGFLLVLDSAAARALRR